MSDTHYIVTIQRQFGSLGRPIAKEMAKLLQIEYYDRDIVEMASREMKVNKEEVQNYDEKSYTRMKYPLGTRNQKMQDIVFGMQMGIIRELAGSGKSCIIVGRCADYILRNDSHAINFFIYAPYEKRLENCVKVLGMTEKDAEKMIHEVDKARDNYHRYYTDLPPETIENRQLLIDSSLFGVEGTAQVLSQIVLKKIAAGFGTVEDTAADQTQ